jgi:hypothetical protein
MIGPRDDEPRAVSPKDERRALWIAALVFALFVAAALAGL